MVFKWWGLMEIVGAGSLLNSSEAGHCLQVPPCGLWQPCPEASWEAVLGSSNGWAIPLLVLEARGNTYFTLSPPASPRTKFRSYPLSSKPPVPSESGSWLFRPVLSLHKSKLPEGEDGCLPPLPGEFLCAGLGALLRSLTDFPVYCK